MKFYVLPFDDGDVEDARPFRLVFEHRNWIRILAREADLMGWKITKAKKSKLISRVH